MVMKKSELRIPGCEPIKLKDSTQGQTAPPRLTGEDSKPKRRRRARTERPAADDDLSVDDGEATRMHQEFLTMFRNHKQLVNANRRGLA